MPQKTLDHAEPYDSPLFRSQVQIENDVGGNPVYIGRSGPKVKSSEALWQIMKLTYSGGYVTRVTFANNNNTQQHVWDDRASYDYTPDDE